MNTEFLNSDIVRITDYIDRVRPQRLALVELNPELFESLKQQGKYQYAYYYPNFVHSFGFFTNDEVLEQRTYMSGDYPIGYFRTKDRDYFVVHPLPPFDPEMYSSQKKFFAAVVALVSNQEHFILVGDFNSTPYSRVFQSFF
jgi:hypothetical protein